MGGLNGAGRALQTVRLDRRCDRCRRRDSLALLAYLVRERRRPGFRLALAAAILFALALVLWWVLVYPVNVELAKWVNGPVPADWTDYRARWEWGHAIISVLELAGFAALVASVLTDTGRSLR